MRADWSSSVRMKPRHSSSSPSPSIIWSRARERPCKRVSLSSFCIDSWTSFTRLDMKSYSANKADKRLSGKIYAQRVSRIWISSKNTMSKSSRLTLVTAVKVMMSAKACDVNRMWIFWNIIFILSNLFDPPWKECYHIWMSRKYRKSFQSSADPRELRETITNHF